MASAVIDISMFGDKELERALAKLPTAASQKKTVRPALRDSVKHLRPKIAAASPFLTGHMRETLAKAKIRAVGKRGILKYGTLQPEDKDDAIAVRANEYGSVKRGIPPRPFIRPTVDANRQSEFGLIGRQIGKGIEREWARLVKK